MKCTPMYSCTSVLIVQVTGSIVRVQVYHGVQAESAIHGVPSPRYGIMESVGVPWSASWSAIHGGVCQMHLSHIPSRSTRTKIGKKKQGLDTKIYSKG